MGNVLKVYWQERGLVAILALIAPANPLAEDRDARFDTKDSNFDDHAVKTRHDVIWPQNFLKF
jgi:hypothetical protein